MPAEEYWKRNINLAYLKTLISIVMRTGQRQRYLQKPTAKKPGKLQPKVLCY